MLKLVMKYDLKNCFRRALPLLSVLFISTTLALGLLYFALSLGAGAVTFALLTFFALCMLAMSAVFFVLLAIGVVCFYRSLFTDEGYLMMSIPMKTRRLLNAKLLSVVLYECVILAAGVVALLLSTVLPATLYDAEGFLTVVRAVMSALEASQVTPTVLVLYFLWIFIEFIAQSLILLSSVVIGSIAFIKHRIIGSVGVFLGVNTALSILELILSYIVEATVSDALLLMILPMIFGIALIITACVILYFISHRLMAKSYNII